MVELHLKMNIQLINDKLLMGIEKTKNLQATFHALISQAVQVFGEIAFVLNIVATSANLFFVFYFYFCFKKAEFILFIFFSINQKIKLPHFGCGACVLKY